MSRRRISQYVIGHTVERTIEVRNREGVLTNPVDLVVTVEKPGGTDIPIGEIPISTGRFRILIPTDEVGVWYIRAEATGDDTAAVKETSFKITASSVEDVD